MSQMSASVTPRVVVGVDPSEQAAAALDWAADEAALRDAGLSVLHARGAGAGPQVERRTHHVWEAADRAAGELLLNAEHRVRARQPSVEVECSQLYDAPLPALLDAVGPDDLLVVGSHGYGRFTTTLIGSVSQGVAAHAPCPVVVVPDRGASVRTAPVVLGVAQGEHPAPIEFAFVEADRRSVPLLAVRSWNVLHEYPGILSVSADERMARDREETEDLARLLGEVRARHPGVPVQTQADLGAAEAALIHQSGNAALVVLGAARTHGRLAPPLGRVVQRVLHHALCPVALVPHA